MKRSLLAFSVVLAALIFANCGTVFRGTRQTIQADSSPTISKITVTPDGSEYTTPVSIKLQRKHNYILRFSMEGYTTAEVQLQKKLSAGIVVLDIVAGLVGVIVDASTGAWYSLSPDSVNVTLERVAAIEGPDEIGIQVSLKGDTMRIESEKPGVTARIESTDTMQEN